MAVDIKTSFFLIVFLISVYVHIDKYAIKMKLIRVNFFEFNKYSLSIQNKERCINHVRVGVITNRGINKNKSYFSYFILKKKYLSKKINLYLTKFKNE